MQKSANLWGPQAIVPECYGRELLSHDHCTTLAEHQRTTAMYHVFRIKYCWSHMASYVHEFVFKCESCRRRRPSQKQRRWLQLFLSSGLLRFVAIKILRMLKNTKQQNRFIVVMTDRNSKLIRAASVSKMITPHDAMVALES